MKIEEIKQFLYLGISPKTGSLIFFQENTGKYFNDPKHTIWFINKDNKINSWPDYLGSPEQFKKWIGII